jgi:hypothetical protein
MSKCHRTTGYAIFNTTLRRTANPMIGIERLRTGINDGPAGWSSTFNTVNAKYSRFIYMFHPETDHDTTGLCVTFGGAVAWKSRQLKLTAQSTTNLRNDHMIDAFKGMSGGMVIWNKLRAWHGLASVFGLLFSVFCLLFDFCLFVHCLSV